ncbi:MAG: ABC transporter permease [Paludibacteraceae bacterium]|nr:ABC transporter permease [Paludibacteraceae bacterium]
MKTRHIPLFIARRYLFARKGHNAINIVSVISAAGVCVGTAAMICVLSVLNGFSSLIEDLFSAFNPDLRIEVVEGKSFDAGSEVFRQIRSDGRVAVFAETVEETALARYEHRQTPILMKGVDTCFNSLTNIDSIMVDGRFRVSQGEARYAVPGMGVAQMLGIGPLAAELLDIYTPRRVGRVNMMRPDDSFYQMSAMIAGVFSVQQAQYDDRYVLVSLDLARQLLDYEPHQSTAVELRLHRGASAGRMKADLQTLLGSGYRVLDRYDQQDDYFSIVRFEKWLTFLLLSFILLIASFSVIGSLSMLMIDKRENIGVMRMMGADNRFIRRVFHLEGCLISLAGSVCGLVLGVAVCLAQQHFGWLKLGNGSDYIISVYPVELQLADVLLSMAVVLLVGIVVSWIPVRHLKADEADVNKD